MSLPDADLLARLPELSDEEKHKRTLAGLADVDAGRTISHEEMKAWVRSLFLASKNSI
jgi:predicted transcriptional regulator